ncbi:hypothetical protein CTI12_AA507500 [Artemisia annua]|uniref:WEB family n=1 Tax=Artemisia annua TaxID=35608 RepID=A0A2U1LBQ8_ARTAN|nr:hypothetical protein CTI12_AA507500 [Artemisia annua]
MLRSKSRSGYLEFGEKKQSSKSFLIRSISGSKICRGDGISSQVDKEALVSVDRKSISLSENRIVKAAMLQKQMTNLEEELKNTKERLDESENERNRVVAELREAKELANAGLSPTKAEQVFSELKSLKDTLSNSKKEIESRDKQIASFSKQLESAKVFEAKLAERDASLDGLTKRIRELEDQLEKTKQSESQMLESLMFQTQQIEQTKMDLEESKLEVITLHEQLENFQRGNRNGSRPSQSAVSQRGNNFDTSRETKALKEEIAILKSEVRSAMEAEENSKRAMDGLASALREVATEASTANEKLRLTEDQVKHLKEEVERLTEKLELQIETSERLRVESEESLLAWTSKEMGFISCIKKADEETASLKHENNKLREALMGAENTTRIVREESFKLRDILKQALNEASVAKEASSIARAENSELKDLLAEKEESLHFLTKENERLRINEVAARENVKEFKRLLAAKTEADKHLDDNKHEDVFNSPLSSLYEDHLDGRITPNQAFAFDFDDTRSVNKEEEEYYMCYKDEDHIAEIIVNDDPEKAEALKGSIFDTTASPRSEPHTPQSKVQHRRSLTGHTDSGGHGRKKLFRKINELVIGKPHTKKDGTLEHGSSSHGNGPHTKKDGSPEHSSPSQGNEPVKEQGEDQEKDQSKDKGKEQIL